MKLLGIISVDFDVIDRLMIRYSAFVRYCKRNWRYHGTEHKLYV